MTIAATDRPFSGFFFNNDIIPSIIPIVGKKGMKNMKLNTNAIMDNLLAMLI